MFPTTEMINKMMFNNDDDNKIMLSPTSSLRLHFDQLSPETDDVLDERKMLWGMPVPLFLSDKIGPWIDNNQHQPHQDSASTASSVSFDDFSIIRKVSIDFFLFNIFMAFLFLASHSEIFIYFAFLAHVVDGCDLLPQWAFTNSHGLSCTITLLHKFFFLFFMFFLYVGFQNVNGLS